VVAVAVAVEAGQPVTARAAWPPWSGRKQATEATVAISRDQLRAALAEYTLGPAKRNAESAYIDAITDRLWAALEGNRDGQERKRRT
jgi:hypothetical protein